VKILRDLENENKFKTLIFQHQNADRDKQIHVSDLVYCLRKAYFRLKGVTPTDETAVEYQVIGKTLHKIIQDAFKYVEVEVENYGVKGTIDILEGQQTKIPIEIKTTRKKIENEKDIPPTYLTQLAYYLTLLNTHVGYLVILNVINADLKIFTVEINLEETKKQLLGKKQLLEYALQHENPMILPKLEWQCLTCEFRSACNHGV
jgi:CRISPR-associated protein Cas4